MTSPVLGAYYHDTLIPADKDGLEQSSAAVFESEASGEEFQQDSSSSDNDDDGDANEDLDEDDLEVVRKKKPARKKARAGRDDVLRLRKGLAASEEERPEILGTLKRGPSDVDACV